MGAEGNHLDDRSLENVRQVTIQPIIEAFIKPGTLVNTDEYEIYGRLPEWGYEHKTVCHGHGEYARDEDGDGNDRLWQLEQLFQAVNAVLPGMHAKSGRCDGW